MTQLGSSGHTPSTATPSADPANQPGFTIWEAVLVVALIVSTVAFLIWSYPNGIGIGYFFLIGFLFVLFICRPTKPPTCSLESWRDQEVTTATELRVLLKDFVEQRAARWRQTPWLLVAFCLFVAGGVTLAIDITNLVSFSWGGFICLAGAVAAMAGAGCYAEDDPPIALRKEAVAVLRRYTPKHIVAREQLLERLDSGDWKVATIIEFVNSEIIRERDLEQGGS